jgi:hypothetical protein
MMDLGLVNLWVAELKRRCLLIFEDEHSEGCASSKPLFGSQGTALTLGNEKCHGPVLLKSIR